MLPPFIIEQIKRRENRESEQYQQPQLELPVDQPLPSREISPAEETGVVIIPLWD
jgi:hypothetical protein